MNYGKALRVARAIQGIQQKELAERSGFDRSYISLVEKNRRKPSLKAVRSLSRSLEIPANMLTLLAMEPEDLDLADPSEFEQLGPELLNLLLSAKDSE
jgi:transcriptional regulator with XRE-family HTH domain